MLKNDVRFTVTGGRSDFWQKMAHGKWEPGTFAVFDRYIGQDTTVFDVGAWIGPTAFYAAQRGKRVYAFEPDPVAFAELSRNLEANPTIRNVQILNECVGVKEGHLRLGVRWAPGNSKSSLLSADSAVGWDVRSIRLDEFIQRHDVQDPIFIKMDIEGYEYELIPALADSLNARDMVLHLSTHPHIAARRRLGESVAAKIVGRLRMLLANARLAWTLGSFAAVFDSSGQRINLWTRVPRALLGRSFTRDTSIVVVSRPSESPRAMNHPPEAPMRSWSARSSAQSIPARFEEHVSADRDRLAVSAAGRRLTYGALNEGANRVARVVLAMAPHTGTVAVLIGQGASIIIAMLGVWKTGKIFVPLDTRQPAPRMRQILDDCQAELLITDNSSLSDAQALLRPGLTLLNVDALDAALSADNLGLSIRGDALAYLIYTSGSTGSPKGVGQTHRNLLHKTRAHTDVLQLSREDRLTLLPTCSVGLGLSSALQALLNGASLHPFDLRELGVGELAPWLIAHGITVFISTPSTFRHFAGTLTPPYDCPTLRVIRLGGEQIFPHDLELHRQHFPAGCVLVGEFASTETGPVTTYIVNRDIAITDRVPAGYPLDGMTVVILDDAGRPRPAGEVGEIAVRSRFLSPGYWRDPDRTAAAFVEVPGQAGEKLYRTGDLGLLRPDGCLEHRGRKDFRVKIRGFRVELEEIEHSLCANPCVLEAAVVARPDDLGVNQLVAYVVPQAGQSPTVNDVRAYLRNTLPEQMVPATVEFLPTLPRTASGKVHRAALPPPQGTASAVPVVDRPPRDAVERRLIHLWEDLLEQRPISVTANFFELGGHSLLAVRLCTAIEQTFGAKLPLAMFVKAATIERQAQLLREQRPQTAWPSLVPICESGSKPSLFCVHLGEGHVLSYRDLARHLPSDQPLYGLQSRGLDGTSRINTRIEDMARDYVAEIRKLQPCGPYAICGWSFGGMVAFEMARQLEQERQAVALLALFDTRVPERPRGAEAWLLRNISRLLTCATTFLHVPDRLPSALESVTQANRNAFRDYVPKPYGGRVTLFKAIERRSQRPRDPLLGWGPFVPGGLEVHEVSATHDNIVFEPHVRTLAEKLTRCLEKAWAGAEASASKPSGTGHGGDRAA